TGWISLPVAASQRRTAWSHVPVEASVLPFGANATEETERAFASQWRTSFAVSASQRRIIRSCPPEAKRLPSGEKATEQTHPSCPFSRCSSLPVFTFHNRIRSLPADVRTWPSGEKATEQTRS